MPAAASDAVVLQQLVASGLRAQLRTGNLLTGQLYVALDFIPGAARKHRARSSSDGAVRMPTAPGTLSELQPQIAEIVQKMSKIPFDDIGRDLRTTLRSANAAIGQLTPDAQKALAEVQRTLSQRADDARQPRPQRHRPELAGAAQPRGHAGTSCSARRARCASSPTTCNSIRKRCCAASPPTRRCRNR